MTAGLDLPQSWHATTARRRPSGLAGIQSEAITPTAWSKLSDDSPKTNAPFQAGRMLDSKPHSTREVTSSGSPPSDLYYTSANWPGDKVERSFEGGDQNISARHYWITLDRAISLTTLLCVSKHTTKLLGITLDPGFSSREGISRFSL